MTDGGGGRRSGKMRKGLVLGKIIAHNTHAPAKSAGQTLYGSRETQNLKRELKFNALSKT